MRTIVKFQEEDITSLARAGKWRNPNTGIIYPSNWDFSTVEGVTVLEVEETGQSIDDVYNDKLAYINQSRIDANNGTFTFLGKQISCSADGRTNIDAINGIVSLTGSMPPNWVGVWKAEDNSYVSIPDLATWTLFYGAMVAQGIANFTQSETLKAQLTTAYSANDIQAMEALEWT